MSLIKYEPVNFLSRIQNDINDFFHQNGYRSLPSLFNDEDVLITSEWSPRVDIKEDDQNFIVTADIPGVDPKDIKVTMSNNVLSIKGERKTEKEEKKKNYRMNECFWGSFERSFRMPETADGNKIKAAGKHGVLNITIAKKPAPETHVIKVES